MIESELSFPEESSHEHKLPPGYHELVAIIVHPYHGEVSFYNGYDTKGRPITSIINADFNCHITRVFGTNSLVGIISAKGAKNRKFASDILGI